jgi:hypothetical protein
MVESRSVLSSVLGLGRAMYIYAHVNKHDMPHSPFAAPNIGQAVCEAS